MRQDRSTGGRRHSLQTQMLSYVGFLGTVFLTLAVEITLLLRGVRVRGVIESAAARAGVAAEPFLEPLSLVLVKIGLMLGILLLSVALVMTLLVKRVTIPLARIIDGAARIGEGDLSVVLPGESRDELGRLACSINDLAANYQEVLLLTGGLVGRTRSELEGLIAALEEKRAVLGQGRSRSVDDRIDAMTEALDELSAVVEEFGQGYFGDGGSA